MPQQKDFKRVVRARMQKTGESYTAARAQLLRKPKTKTTRLARALNAPSVADYAKLAGMSDAVVKAKTGCNWERWVKALDKLGADRLSHREVATLVNQKFEVGPWWGQMLTVGYERIKGLRARGQRRDGSYEATKSRTFDVPVERLFGAWADANARKQWIGDTPLRIRKATAPKSMRLDWPEGGIVAVGFTPKGKSKSCVAIAHDKLPNPESAKEMKAYWGGRLSALGQYFDKR